MDVGNQLLLYSSMSFVVPLFTVTNGVLYVQEKRLLMVRYRGSVSVSMVKVRVRVRASCQVVWSQYRLVNWQALTGLTPRRKPLASNSTGSQDGRCTSCHPTDSIKTLNETQSCSQSEKITQWVSSFLHPHHWTLKERSIAPFMSAVWRQ